MLKKLKCLVEPKQYTSVDINKLSREKKLDYIFIDSDFEYYEDDFKNYLSQEPANLEEFKRRHEEIKEKFIDKTIFD